jgi:hypothetical protein
MNGACAFWKESEMSNHDRRLGELEAANVAKAKGSFVDVVRRALAVPLNEIPVPSCLEEMDLRFLDQRHPDLAAAVRREETTAFDAVQRLWADERRGNVNRPPPPVEPPLPSWLVAAQQVRQNHPGAQTGPSPYTAEQPGSYDPRAERQAQWRGDEEEADRHRRLNEARLQRELDRAAIYRNPAPDIQTERQTAAWQAEQRRMEERERVRAAGYGPTRTEHYHPFGQGW